MPKLPSLLWIALAILLIDSGLALRDGDWWGAARTLAIVVLLPLAFRGSARR